MAEINLDRAKELEKEAEANGGHCTHCEQTLKIYRYGISESMVRVLREMARRTKLQLDGNDKAGRVIDVDATLNLKHSERTQLTKMRFHGLVAKVKEDGRQIPRHWIITTKGWNFLGNEAVPAKVIVYNNQVLGHDGGMIDIRRIAGGNGEFEAKPVSEAESRTYAHIREPQRQSIVTAEWLGRTAGSLVQGQQYTLLIDRLQIGKPVSITIKEILQTEPIKYNDVAAFGKSWKVVKNND